MSRIFQNFNEATNEIKRDLAELGTKLAPTTWQGRSVEGDPDYITKELQNYLYTVTDPNPNELNPTQPWADLELEERLGTKPVNPGEAYKTRPEVWNELLVRGEIFSYTYSERLIPQLPHIIDTLTQHPASRQIFVSIWDVVEDPTHLEEDRVPCSLGYYLQFRHGKLNITYLQRSCDFVTHYENDVWLAVRFLQHIAKEVGMESGHFSHWIGSLHVFQKDVEDVF